MHTVADLMTPNPVTASPSTPIDECARLMLRHHFRHLPVRDEAGRVAGVINDFDVFRRGGFVWSEEDRWVAFDQEDAQLVALDLAAAVELTVGPEAPADRLLARLAASRQDFALVVDDRHAPIGIVTEHDACDYARTVLPADVLLDHHATRPVLAIDRRSSARLALDLMITNGVRHLIVVDKGVLHGVISHRDLVTYDVARRPGISAGDAVGRRHPRTVHVGMPLTDAAALMVTHRIGCLPVLGAGEKPIRMLTRTDVVAALAFALEEETVYLDADAG